MAHSLACSSSIRASLPYLTLLACVAAGAACASSGGGDTAPFPLSTALPDGGGAGDAQSGAAPVLDAGLSDATNGAAPPGQGGGAGEDAGGGSSPSSGSDDDGGQPLDGSAGPHADGGAGGSSSADAGVHGDSGGALTGSCGAAFCRGGQECSAGECVYEGCAGAKVPGDYDSVQSAVTALLPIGGTICLAAQAYDENVVIGDLAASLTIMGVSAAATSITSLTVDDVTAATAPITLTVEGLSTTAPSLVMQLYGTLNVANCSFVGATTSSAGSGSDALSIAQGLGTLTANITASTFVAAAAGSHGLFLTDASQDVTNLVVTLDGDDFSGANMGARIVATSAATKALVQNCYFHDSGAGLEFEEAVGATARVVNDTFERNTIGLYWDAEANDGVLYNDLFDGNQTGMIVWASLPASAFGNNALWDNTTNYGSLAVAGTGYVTADPLLDTSTPPAPLSGSPLRGAGSAAYTPATDYWGRSRGARADIGAVEGQ